MLEPAPPVLGIKKLIIYCEIHGLSIIEWSPGAPPRPGKVNNIYRKIHGLIIVEWSPGAPPRPVKVNNIL